MAEGLYVNFVDFKKAFGSIHRDLLWKILQLYSIPQKYINIFQALYQHIRHCIRINEGVTDMFDILAGVRQGCIVSSFFLIVVDVLMRQIVHRRARLWHHMGNRKVSRFGLITLISDSPVALQNMISESQGNAAKVGLLISAETTMALAVGNTQGPEC